MREKAVPCVAIKGLEWNDFQVGLRITFGDRQKWLSIIMIRCCI